MNSCSGFEFSRFPSNEEQHLIVSIPTFHEMLESYVGSVDKVPMGRLLIKLSTSDDDIIDELFS